MKNGRMLIKVTPQRRRAPPLTCLCSTNWIMSLNVTSLQNMSINQWQIVARIYRRPKMTRLSRHWIGTLCVFCQTRVHFSKFSSRTFNLDGTPFASVSQARWSFEINWFGERMEMINWHVASHWRCSDDSRSTYSLTEDWAGIGKKKIIRGFVILNVIKCERIYFPWPIISFRWFPFRRSFCIVNCHCHY